MRIVLLKEEIIDGRAIISGEKARYLISVMRCRTGDKLQVLDSDGGFYNAGIAEINSKQVAIELLEKITYDTESSLNLVLVQGILKGEKMDLIIQKATELGIKEIIPAVTERSQIRQTRKVERWRKIAEEASRQSGRNVIPEIHEPVELGSWLMAHGKQDMKGFIFWEEGGLPLAEAVRGVKIAAPLNPSLGKGGQEGVVFIAIGPEGGFTKEEVELAESKGLAVVSLGKRILRAETAAISAVTLVQFLMGDLNL